MLIHICPLKIGDNRMERQPLSRSLFSCCAYRGAVHDYVASQVPPHSHRELEVVMVDGWESERALADAQIRGRAGEGYFVHAEKLHSIRSASDGPCLYRSVVFDPAIVSGIAGSPFDLKYVRPLVEQGPFSYLLSGEEAWQRPVFAAFEDAFHACAKEDPGFEFTVRHALSRIVLALTEHAGEPNAARPVTVREEKLKQMVEWIDENYMRPVRLKGLADAVHFSPRECERVFQRLLKITPYTYLLRRRIAAAALLLVGGDLPITEVSERCGFSTHSYFSRQFRALTGLSPRDYRKNACA